MQISEATMGRVFVLRLENGDRLPDVIERFAADHHLARAVVFYVGGAQDGSRLVVGPEAGGGDAIIAMIHTLQGVQEVLGVGTIFPDEPGCRSSTCTRPADGKGRRRWAAPAPG